MIINIMARQTKSQTMTDILREALRQAESLRGVARATGIQQSSLSRFLAGKSLRLDLADRLAAYFHVESERRTNR